MRFLIGAAEAGFFPGVILYLTHWYPAKRRSHIIALFMRAIPIAGVLGGLVSGWILSSLDRHHGLSGWQWLFIVESIPSLLVGIAALLYLDDGIESAKWLTPRQKTFLRSQLAQDNAGKSKHSIGAALTSGRVWLLALVYFGSMMGQYGFGFWLPTIIRQTGVASLVQISLLSTIPYAFGMVAMLGVGRSADQRREHRFHFAVPAALGALGLLGCGLYTGNTVLALAALTVACIGLSCLAPVFWVIPPAMLDGAAAAAGIALINCLGNLAGFVSPFMMGWMKDHTGSTDAGMAVIAACLLLAAAIVVRACRRAEAMDAGASEENRPGLLNHFYILPGHQAKGIGATALRDVVASADEQGGCRASIPVALICQEMPCPAIPLTQSKPLLHNRSPCSSNCRRRSGWFRTSRPRWPGRRF